MMTWTHWADHPAVVSMLGWTLIHFLWQGALLAAVMASALRWTNAAENRYRLGVVTLLAMVAAPIITFVYLSGQQALPTTDLGTRSNGAISMIASTLSFTKSAPVVNPAFNWAEAAAALWLAGVFLFGLRAAGGWWMLSRLGKRCQESVPEPILATCLELRRRMGIRRMVRFCVSAAVDAPAVLGWFRPIVLLPLASISGLSLEQLEAVIAHELAHIRRLDAFVNALQVVVETLLFYHPAVWWVNRVIRTEREHCCDDVAVAVRGDALDYARALALMEESRLLPQWAMAANSRPLRDRVARLLGVKAPARQVPTSLAIAFLAMASGAALLAERPALSETLTMIEERLYSTPAADATQTGQAAGGVKGVAVPGSDSEPQISHVVTKTQETRAFRSVRATRVLTAVSNLIASVEASAGVNRLDSESEQDPQAESKPAHSYIEEMASAGYRDLTVDQLVSLKVQGVTAEYVRELAEAGLHPDIHQLIALKVQGVTGSYVREIRATGMDPDLKHVIAMKVQGVDAGYIRGIIAAGLRPDVNQVIAMKVQGVDADYIKELKAAGIDADLEHVVAMKVQGITPEYAREIRSAGWNPTTNELIAMKIQGVDPSDAAEFGKLGFKDLSIHEIIGAKIQGVTPGYVRAMRAAGITSDSMKTYVTAKIQDVTPEFVEKARQHGFKDLTLDKLIRLRVADVL